MAEYYTQKVDIVIEVGSDLHDGIRNVAEIEGVSFDEMVNRIVGLGLHRHMSENLNLFERLGK